MTGSSDSMSVHHGEAFFHLAGTYKYLLKTLVEAAQNGIDADAETIFIGVDVKRRLAIVLDDGKGIARDKYRAALLSVGKGIKDTSSLGRFGLGMISPLNKCRVFTITSKPMGQGRVVNQWTFEAEYVKSQHGMPDIPYEDVKVMPEIPAQFAPYANKLGARWRTELRIVDIVDNRTLTHIDPESLESQIRTKLRREMIKKGTTIYVVLLEEDGVGQFFVDASQPTGEPFEVATINDPKLKCGRVTFTLFKAREDASGRRRGVVDVMRKEDNTAVEWSEFRAQALTIPETRPLADKIKVPFDALSSGFFEGTIEIENVELAADRETFKPEPTLTSSYVAIYEWFLRVGQHHYQEEKAVRRDDRYRELGQQALQRLYDRFGSNPTYQALVDGVAGLLPDHDVFGSRQPRPRDPSKPPVVKPPKVMARRPEFKPSGPRAPREEATTFRLSFAYDILPGSKRLWEFNITSGLVTFNVRHPTWIELDQSETGKHTAQNDADIIHLQLYTALQILILLRRVGREEFDESREEVDLTIDWYVGMFMTGSKSRKKSK